MLQWLVVVLVASDCDKKSSERGATAEVQASNDNVWTSRKKLKLCRSVPLLSCSIIYIYNHFLIRGKLGPKCRRSCCYPLPFGPPVGTDWLHSSLASYGSRNFWPPLLTDWSHSSSRVLFFFFKLLLATPPPGHIRSVQPGPSRPVRPGWCRISLRKPSWWSQALKTPKYCQNLWKTDARGKDRRHVFDWLAPHVGRSMILAAAG